MHFRKLRFLDFVSCTVAGVTCEISILKNGPPSMKERSCSLARSDWTRTVPKYS